MESIPRWWDIQVKPVQLDVRVARYGEISVSASWFIPNPIAVIDAAENLVTTCSDSAEGTATTSTISGELNEEDGTRTADVCLGMKSKGEEMISDLKEAGQSFFVTISVRGIVDGKYRKWKK